MARLASAPEKRRRLGQLVICVIRIGADDKSRPASPITLDRRAGAFPQSSKQKS
jgi:hypothetical protein